MKSTAIRANQRTFRSIFRLQLVVEPTYYRTTKALRHEEEMSSSFLYVSSHSSYTGLLCVLLVSLVFLGPFLFVQTLWLQNASAGEASISPVASPRANFASK